MEDDANDEIEGDKLKLVADKSGKRFYRQINSFYSLENSSYTFRTKLITDDLTL